MENPHEKVQNSLLSRIIANMENLNESVIEVNDCLQEINRNNLDLEILSNIWKNYLRSSEFNLEATFQKKEPL